MKFFGRKSAGVILVLLSSILLTACVSTGKLEKLPTVDENSLSANKNITIALLGATGMVGGFVLELAIEQGYQIRALARTPAKLEAFRGRIGVVEGDARDPAAIEALLRGADVVLSTLGPVRADGDAAKMLNTTATMEILALMPEHGIERYILVSGAAVTAPGDDRNLTGWLVQKSAAISLRRALVDKQAEYELLADSSVAWTAIRCPVIKATPYRQSPEASLDTPGSFTLRAGELAFFMLKQINAREFIGKSPFLVSR
jgi:putative NADH-flavin reductase